MAAETRYIFVVSMNVSADKEDVFNEVYDTEHVPFIMDVPGVVRVTRAKVEPFSVSIGGKDVSLPSDPQEPVYTAIYELESAEVLSSPEWAVAVEKGRWAEEVRPFTSNRKHALRKVTAVSER